MRILIARIFLFAATRQDVRWPTGKMPALRSEPRDLTPGDHDAPPFNLAGQDMYAISPDSQELASEKYVTLLHERHVR